MIFTGEVSAARTQGTAGPGQLIHVDIITPNAPTPVRLSSGPPHLGDTIWYQGAWGKNSRGDSVFIATHWGLT